MSGRRDGRSGDPVSAANDRHLVVDVEREASRASTARRHLRRRRRRPRRRVSSVAVDERLRHERRLGGVGNVASLSQGVAFRQHERINL